MGRLVKLATKDKALVALKAMERELAAASTYERIRKIIKAAEAVKYLHGEITEVKQEAEWVILYGNQRIAEELERVPKAAGGDRKSKLPRGVNLNEGRAATGISGTSRSRLGKLRQLGGGLRTVAEGLWQKGKDATIKAVLGEKKEAEIKQARAEFERRRESGGTVDDLVALAQSGKRFKVIYADPPWEFKVYSGKGKQRSAERHYDTSSLAGIKALPVTPLADGNCALFLWCVCPELSGALEVIRDWGFEFKTVAFAWVKTAKRAHHIDRAGNGLHWGMGYWTRSNVELCLLATRGMPERDQKDVHQVVIENVGEHSEKPEEVRKRIERLVLGPYLELFGRRAVPGWTVWGNEIERAEAAE